MNRATLSVRPVDASLASAGLSVRPGEVARRSHKKKSLPHHRIEISLRDISQFFNSMDPSPFHEKDLDHDAEEFIVSWVQEYHRHDPVSLLIHLKEFPSGENPQATIEAAVHNYFAAKAKLNRLEFRRLMKQGRLSLLIGLAFLASCLLTSQIVAGTADGAFQRVVRESLTIAGWVAMWRPMQIYLYDWWPLCRRGQIFEKMSRMKVDVKPHVKPFALP